ncbi:urease accessory protein UreD [Pseudohoeflea coraliihabitans]|uniref:Urease accessory protein UreD n=1 Tax=Pseudohoeflea coraliihabitans TaxID=2860393 RepID=A0ABS6WJV8_9HYPH|nr:urease accessory protein UreD [Pseudohoeflea sp. DP4N28-3]MBW3096226.1 urease accessory protein UreD [Pseudohoeflea sp. DP4N28-3]
MQRSTGRGRLSVKADASGRTRLCELFQEGSARIRTPNSHSGAHMQAVLLNTSGGMTGGDSLDWHVEAQQATHLSVATQTAERLYRTTADTARLDIRLEAAQQSALHWLAQETILFNEGGLQRTISAHLAADAELLICEPVIYGRAAMGETVTRGTLRDDWRIYRDGRLIHAEAFRLDGAIAARLDHAAIAGGARAAATVALFSMRGEGLMDQVRAIIGPAGGASHLHGKLLCRLLAPDALALRKRLIPLLSALRGGHALPRCWHC